MTMPVSSPVTSSVYTYPSSPQTLLGSAQKSTPAPMLPPGGWAGLTNSTWPGTLGAAPLPASSAAEPDGVLCTKADSPHGADTFVHQIQIPAPMPGGPSSIASPAAVKPFAINPLPGSQAPNQSQPLTGQSSGKGRHHIHLKIPQNWLPTPEQVERILYDYTYV